MPRVWERDRDPDRLAVLLPEGRMLLAYSGGLHHVQAPDELRFGLFEVDRMRLANLDTADYRSGSSPRRARKASRRP